MFEDLIRKDSTHLRMYAENKEFDVRTQIFEDALPFGKLALAWERSRVEAHRSGTKRDWSVIRVNGQKKGLT